MFNPSPTVHAVPLFDGHECLVVDNALEEPEGWAQWTLDERRHFRPSGLAYPGVEMWLAEQATDRYAEFFAQHIRSRLDARRTINTACRMSLVTLAPHELDPRQWSCHRDDRGMPADEIMVASVLYLFKDETLGGTCFYRPRRSAEDTDRLMLDAGQLSREAFMQRYPTVQPGFITDSNDWFEHVLTVPARWNRAIFYDGGLFHSGDIREPGRMSADPAQGRLTMNAFMRCRRKAR